MTLFSKLQLESKVLNRFADTGKQEVINQAVGMKHQPSGERGIWVVNFTQLQQSPRALGVIDNTRRSHDIMVMVYKEWCIKIC